MNNEEIILLFLQGFNNHTHNDHSMWAYVYYYVYLDQIYAGNHTAIENYVYEKVIIVL